MTDTARGFLTDTACGFHHSDARIGEAVGMQSCTERRESARRVPADTGSAAVCGG